MNPTHDEENLIRWLDGEMDEAEKVRFEEHLAANPALKAEAEEMRRLTDAVRKNLPQPGDIPHADFFNSQIQREIESLKMQEQRGGEKTSAGIFSWFRLPWLIAGTAALVAALSVVKPRFSEGTTEVVSSYAPNPEVKVSVMESADAKATVVVLDGLPEMPADLPMVSYKVSRSENDPRMAMTTLFDDNGKVLAVVMKGRDGSWQVR